VPWCVERREGVVGVQDARWAATEIRTPGMVRAMTQICASGVIDHGGASHLFLSLNVSYIARRDTRVKRNDKSDAATVR
jgi:hypothetical protein